MLKIWERNRSLRLRRSRIRCLSALYIGHASTVCMMWQAVSPCFLLLFDHVMSPGDVPAPFRVRVSFNLLCASPHRHTIDSFPFPTKFSSSSHYADRQSPLFHAIFVPCGPSQVWRQSRSHICREGVLLDIGIIDLSLRTFSLSPYVLDPPLSIPESPLLQWSFHHFRQHTSHTLVVYAPIVTHLITIQ